MIFWGQKAGSGPGGLSKLELILQVGSAGFACLCLPLQNCAEWGHTECRQDGTIPSLMGKAIAPLRLAVMSGGPLKGIFAAGPLLLSTLWSLKAAVYFVKFLNKDFLMKTGSQAMYAGWVL